MILDAIRTATRPIHDRLEGSADIIGQLHSRDAYRRLLQRFLGFYEPLEQRLAAITGYETVHFDPAPRLKAHKIHADLLWLGMTGEEIAALPRCERLPTTDSLPNAMGCWYVLEGATLGGQMIRRQLESTLGLNVNTGVAFFSSYGSEIGKMWNAFCISLGQSASTTSDESKAISSAVETFGLFASWLREQAS
ncbi:biliverdin-producing heme oxygenase [Zavarzinella formosa]|uniref:biliverdin-producing heme oxygenase n=1 Tax=Zavarzinella formosa TaxID=360055 RepID=UPI00030B77F7|nr:biliverdin-producing heme oxygenase [Zavarzinella formosa]